MNCAAVCLLLCALHFVCAQAEGETGFHQEMPPYLRMTQVTKTQTGEGRMQIRKTYPDTANEEIDAQMRGLIDAMAEEALARIAVRTRETDLDVGAVVSRSGSSYMSFLTIAQANEGTSPLFVQVQSRVYDVKTGKRVTLKDVFGEQSEAWTLMAQEVRAQLSAAFPGREPDEETLARFCSREALENADFTLGAARLTLTYPADSLYPGAVAPLHVHLYYSRIRPMMTETAQAQTDNSRFPMIALTYDDGGAGISTRRVLDELRRAGAQATFFVVGRTIGRSRYLLTRQQSSAYSIQSHTYTHSYPEDLNTEMAFEEKARFSSELAQITGVPPTMMRAPGGNESFYVRREIGYPLLHWSLASGDSGNKNYSKIARRVIHGAQDGDIVLMHDLNIGCWQYSARILEALSQRGFLFVTVEELFDDAGVELEENGVYYSPYDRRE